MTNSLQIHKTRKETSAGGIVFRKTPIVIPKRPFVIPSAVEGSMLDTAQNDIEVLLCQHSFHHGWVFPKGLIGDKDEFKNQTKEETAIREVKEETGADGEILQKLEPITYWYVLKGQKIRKTVYYFIMRYLGGDITRHDFEMENVKWVSEKDVGSKLTYPGDKKVWEQAKEIIKNLEL